MVNYEILGKECRGKIVKKQGSSGVVYLPKSWVGHGVLVVLDGE